MGTSTPRRDVLRFRFPAGETHAGIPLSNGTFGSILWGEGRCLRITVNRADYWDRRGGLEFSEEATYANLRTWLEAGNEQRLREVFEGSGVERPGVPPRPTRLPMGRFELTLPDGWAINSGELDLQCGEASLALVQTGTGESAVLRASVLRDSPALCVRVVGLRAAALPLTPHPPRARDVVAYFERYGFPPPACFTEGELAGWTQERPEEQHLCVACLRVEHGTALTCYVTAVYGDGAQEARAVARGVLEGIRGEGYTSTTLRSIAWWGRWWDTAAEVTLPDTTLQLLYRVGMYKLAGLSVPGSPAATLQGPWVEDDRLPPWSGDYHFNVNVQECYWPCFAGNHPECLLPLAEMLREWLPRLRDNARAFAGVDDGLMLPHSTDDRGTAMSGFWTGFVDHGSTAWTAQLFWQYWRYTGDRQFLRDVAYPFLRGSLRVYEALLEPDGERLCLPVSVSPEYGGAGLHAWGRNASFQLALVHFLARSLLDAGELLGVEGEPRERWAELLRQVPRAAVGPGPEILLWEGQPLAESHRHHSHLAGIYPFDLFDPRRSEADATLVRNSLRRWTRMGQGMWTGWCLPWAAILHARAGNGEMAALTLETFRRAFMGPGYASTHDAVFPGYTVMDGRPSIMQVEAALGAAAAVLEMLCHTAGGVLRVFPALPRSWEEASFRHIRTEGAFLVDAILEGGQVSEVQILSECGQTLHLANPWGSSSILASREGKGPTRYSGRVVEIPTAAGERLKLIPAP